MTEKRYGMLEFIKLLKCPITDQSLSLVDESELDAIKDSSVKLYHTSGHPFKLESQQLIKVDGRGLYYTILDDIFCLLSHLVLVEEKELDLLDDFVADETKKQLQSFYDDVGWLKEGGHYVDAKDSEDLRTISSEYIQRCHQRVKKHLAPGGQYLLDCASGPIQYPEYLEYSKGYQYRICADISIRGLQEAKKKLQEKGLYLLCDMTSLPLVNNCVDGVVSLHTIYHIPKEQQSKAVEQVYRVLKPSRSLVLVYSWGGRSLLMNALMMPFKVWNKLRASVRATDNAGASLYFYAHSYPWYKKTIRDKYQAKLYPWRSVNVPFLKKYIHRVLMGRFVLKLIYQLENRCPHLMARIGAYPMIVIKKAAQMNPASL